MTLTHAFARGRLAVALLRHIDAEPMPTQRLYRAHCLADVAHALAGGDRDEARRCLAEAAMWRRREVRSRKVEEMVG